MSRARTDFPRRLLLIVIFGIFLSNLLHAQIKFDVKTSWTQKYALTVAKSGVIAAIESSEWGTSVEFGEDYALYLKNLKRTKGTNDTIILTLDVELRKPSFLSEGELIEKKIVSVRYDPGTLDSLASLEGMGQRVANYREEREVWNRLIATAVGIVIPKGKAFVFPILNVLLETINASPKPEEVYEAVLIGAYVMECIKFVQS